MKNIFKKEKIEVTGALLIGIGTSLFFWIAGNPLFVRFGNRPFLHTFVEWIGFCSFISITIMPISIIGFIQKWNIKASNPEHSEKLVAIIDCMKGRDTNLSKLEIKLIKIVKYILIASIILLLGAIVFSIIYTRIIQ